MATLEEIGDALRNAHAAGDTAAATKLADAYAAMQAGGGVAPPAAPKPVSQWEGVKQGVGNALDNASEMASKIPYVGPAVDAVGQAIGLPSTHQAVTENRAARANSPEAPGAAGEFAGDVAATLPIAAVMPGGIFGTLASGGLGGAVTAEPGHQMEGGVLGAGLGGLLHGAGRAIAPMISPIVQRLADRGVTMTPGQIFGGSIKGLEDRAAGIWPLDGWIRGAQRQSLRDANTATGNIAMGGLGPIPPGISGQAMSTTAHRIFDDAYGQVLPQLNVTLDPAFAQTVNNAGDTVAARLPDEMSGQFQGTLGDVFKKMGAGQPGPSNTFSGRAAKDAYSDLGTEARAHQGPNEDANSRALGRAFGDVQEGIRQSFFNSDPWAAGALGNIDTAYRNFIPVDNAITRASGNAGGLEAGVPTGQQLRQAVIGTDNSARKVASAQGGPALQQHAEDMIQVLPSSIGSSGTAERMGLFALPAAAAAAYAHPALAAGAAAVPALYSRPGLAAFNTLYAHGAGPTQTAIGRIVQDLGRYQAGPLAGLTTGGHK